MIPVSDFVRRRTTPYVNWTLIAINAAVFVYMLTLSTTPDEQAAGIITSQTDRFVIDWGFVPGCIAEYFGVSTSANPRELAVLCPAGNREPLQIITAMFVHAGWAHILGNMLFLWIFGDNVEDRLGHLRYLAFYIICGIAASTAQIAMSPGTTIPNVGASGAIAGVLGAYLFLYPKALVPVIILPVFFLPFVVPAAVLIVLWFVTQVFSGLAEIGNTSAGSGVAFWAHVGGFIAGALLVWLFKRRPRPGGRRAEA